VQALGQVLVEALAEALVVVVEALVWVQALGEALVWVLVWVQALGQAWGEGLVELVTGLEGTRKSPHHMLDNARHQGKTVVSHYVGHNKPFRLHGKAPNSMVWAQVRAEAWDRN